MGTQSIGTPDAPERNLGAFLRASLTLFGHFLRLLLWLLALGWLLVLLLVLSVLVIGGGLVLPLMLLSRALDCWTGGACG